ncbi:hypothetical protein K440DRAFT_266576 [Wilcoxina mikolae CBS 423.85]|nr:hypothetical protein K440DRAFT_266576 [Wilcoxina mikolae CBS 423.85]
MVPRPNPSKTLTSRLRFDLRCCSPPYCITSHPSQLLLAPFPLYCPPPLYANVSHHHPPINLTHLSHPLPQILLFFSGSPPRESRFSFSSFPPSLHCCCRRWWCVFDDPDPHPRIFTTPEQWNLIIFLQHFRHALPTLLRLQYISSPSPGFSGIRLSVVWHIE